MEQQKLLAALGEAGHSWEQVEPLEMAEVSLGGENTTGAVTWDISVGAVLSPCCALVTAAFLPPPPPRPGTTWANVLKMAVPGL